MSKQIQSKSTFKPSCGDLTELNTCRLILDTVGKSTLEEIANNYIGLLETSGAIYEANGDYALGIFSSGWCQFLDNASRQLCNTKDDVEALKCGKWICHDCCWGEVSLESIKTKTTVDIECKGGIHLYAVPIIANGQAIGSLNIGYGNPPTDPEKLRGISNLYQVDILKLTQLADEYLPRTPQIIAAAKSQLHTSAKLIGQIIESKQVQKALQKSESLYHDLVETSQDLIWQCDEEGRYTYLNPAWEKTFGYRLQEMLGRKFTEFQAPNYADADLKTFLLLKKGNSVKGYETVHLGKDGREIHLVFNAKFLTDKDGNAKGTRGTAYDITVRKQAEKALLESAMHFRQSIDNMLEGYALHEAIFNENGQMKDYRFLEFNPAAQQISKIARKDIVGRTAMELYPNIVERGLIDRYADVMATGKPALIEDFYYAGDNLDKAFDISCHRVDDHHFVCMFRDITERKQAEKKLQTSQERLFLATQASNTGIWDWDIVNNVLTWDDSMYAIYGIRKEDFSGVFEAWSNLVPPEDRQYAEAEIQAALRGEREYDTIHRIVRQDGTIRVIKVASRTYFDENGKPLRMIGTNIDITEHKILEKQLRLAKKEWEETFDTINDAITVHDVDYNIIRCNKAAIKLIGLPLENIISSKCYKSYHGTSNPLESCPGCKSLTTGEICISEIFEPHLGKHIEITVLPRCNEDGRLVGLVHVVKDIDERVKTEAEKQILESRLQQAQKMEAIGTLAGGIAHDFNNILGVILGYADMAKDDASPGTQVEKSLSKVLIAAHRAKDLVKQILAFSRQAEVDRIPLKMQPLIKEGLKMLRSSIPTTISITENIDPKSGTVLADPTQIHQILVNLCTNAYHAMETTGGELSVSLKTTFIDTNDQKMFLHATPGEYVELTVSDTGSGIGPDIIEKIFDPYFTTKGIGKGTGMGLAIIHGILKEYGGAITVDTQLGKGTTFHVYIPVIQKDAVPEIKESEDLPKGTARILFIDDEELLAEIGKDMLERLGYHVTVRRSSIEALATFQNTPNEFDLVITDQTMPAMTGSDLARRMMQIRPDIPVILCTGYSNLIDEDSAKGLGIKEFALKPLTKGVVAKLIRKVLDNKN